MTPMNLPSNLRDRRAAMRPTRVKTESRTSLLPLAKFYSRELGDEWSGRGQGDRDVCAIEVRFARQGEPYAFVRNYHIPISLLCKNEGLYYLRQQFHRCIHGPEAEGASAQHWRWNQTLRGGTACQSCSNGKSRERYSRPRKDDVVGMYVKRSKQS
jgi:hypothetical protein